VAGDGEAWKVDVSLWRLGDARRELSFDPDTLCRRLTAETRGAILASGRGEGPDRAAS
jgi:hypothetical protein